uniref:Uncharacterized protein n=1 Tax=Acrobeloides nanus TaxID=290746 RepID=A0A914ED87_9BILA
MVLRSQQNCGDFMTKLQENGLINGYLDNPNPAKRPKLVLDKKKNEEKADDSMDEDEINQILSAQLTTDIPDSQEVRSYGFSQRQFSQRNEYTQIFRHTPTLGYKRDSFVPTPSQTPGTSRKPPFCNISTSNFIAPRDVRKKRQPYIERVSQVPPPPAIPTRVSMKQPQNQNQWHKYCQTDNLHEEESAVKKLQYLEEIKKQRLDLGRFMERRNLFNRLWDVRNILRENAKLEVPIHETLEPMKKILGMDEVKISLEEIFKRREQRKLKKSCKNGVPQKKRRRRPVFKQPKKRKKRISKDPNSRWAMVNPF